MNGEKPRGRPSVRKPRYEVFRQAIETAEAEGVSRADMVLHLTLRDTTGLKRDRNVPVEDISFAGGVMLFLGVTVVSGGAEVSFLGGGELANIPFALSAI